MNEFDTPPSSPEMEQDENEEEEEEEEMIYVGDIDEVIEVLEREDQGEDMEEFEPPTDDAVLVFKKHKDSVFCGQLSEDGKYAVTGGQDDIAYIWDTTSGDVVHECTGHSDSVIFAEFSKDNSFIASGDMSGFIQVWRVSDKKIVWEFNMGDAMWMKWHNQANVLFAGSKEGDVYMWKIPSGDCKIFQGNGQQADNSVLVTDGKKMVVGYEDGSIRVLDLKEGTICATIPPHLGHNSTVTDLDCKADGKVIISAATDGKTLLTTAQTGKVIGVLQYLEDYETNWVESVAFCKDPELHMVATGTLNGEIYIWDSTRQIVRHKIKQECGISKLIWKGKSPLLFSAGFDGCLRCYDARTGQSVKSFYGHSQQILDICVSGDGKKILTTSDDKTARIFDVSEC